MDEQDKKKAEEEKSENKDFVFVREEIKKRPVNKGKLARNTLISAVSALVFGLVAVVTFAFLLPIVTDYFGKDTEEEATSAASVVFPEETVEEEMNPEDMLQTAEPEIVIQDVTPQIDEQEIQDIVDNMDIEVTVEDYQNIFKELSSLAEEAEKSMVKVSSVTTDTDWFNNTLEESNVMPGLIVADNQTDLFIVTYMKNIKNRDNIYVTFQNDVSVKAEYRATDVRTGLCILAVKDAAIGTMIGNEITVATLGSSNVSRLNGSVVIAIGSPMGNYDSMNYGMITSYGSKIYVTDNSYKKITTDIYGSTAAGGFLINISGEVLGIIDNSYSDKTTPNLISAIGVSELKKTIENMINGKDLVRFGVTGSDVPTEAQAENETPRGAYVISVEMDSPAMTGGIQAGDIIVSVGDKSISSYVELVSAIRELVPNEEIEVGVMRQSQEGYKELSFAVIPEVLQ